MSPEYFMSLLSATGEPDEIREECAQRRANGRAARILEFMRECGDFVSTATIGEFIGCSGGQVIKSLQYRLDKGSILTEIRMEGSRKRTFLKINDNG